MPWNTGSFADEVHVQVPDVPTRISGTAMTNSIDMARLKVQRYTGVAISLTSVPELYQNPILHFTCANVLRSMELTGNDATETRIGEYVKKKGFGSASSTSAKAFDDMAEEELKDVGRRSNYSQSL